tara:strand:- start:47 stop:217 length:171 start_codon:yes stop_codon:yes gene_type:complete
MDLPNSNVQIKRTTLDRLKKFREARGITASHVADKSINDFLDRDGFDKKKKASKYN